MQLVQAVSVSRVNYCNGILLGLLTVSSHASSRSSTPQPRLKFMPRWHEHVTSLRRDKLHLLWIPERIIFKRYWLMFRALHDPSCPEYIATLVRRRVTSDRQLHLRPSSRTHLYVTPPSKKTVKRRERSFSHGNTLLLNSLPDSVSSVTSFG